MSEDHSRRWWLPKTVFTGWEYSRVVKFVQRTIALAFSKASAIYGVIPMQLVSCSSGVKNFVDKRCHTSKKKGHLRSGRQYYSICTQIHFSSKHCSTQFLGCQKDMLQHPVNWKLLQFNVVKVHCKYLGLKAFACNVLSSPQQRALGWTRFINLVKLFFKSAT